MSEKGSISSTFTIIILIGLVAITIFVVPLTMTATKVDNASNASVQSSTTDFVNDQCSKGRVSKEDLDKFIETITGPNTYDIEIQVSVAGENQGKKTSQAVSDKVGENVLTTYFDSQVDSQLDKTGEFDIGNGGTLYVAVYQTNTTTAQELTGSDDYGTLVAEASATCTTD